MSSERTHSTPAKKRSRSTTLITGTITALLIAGVAVQVTRAKPGTAGVNDDSGTASISDAPPVKSLARVNGNLVTWDEVAQECMDRHGKEVLENVINRLLIQQACAAKRVEVSEDEVSREIERIAKRFGLDKASWYKMIQAERDLAPIQYRRDIIWPMLALKKLAGEDVKVTREEMGKEYENAYGEKVKARMIMLDNLRRAQAVWEKVTKQPEEFERIAREESIEPNSRALGGVVPPIRRHGAEQLSNAAFKLKNPGEISGIVQVGSRYVILKYEGRTEKIDHDLKDVQRRLYDELLERKVQTMVAETFKGLRDGARIDNYITGDSTGPIRQASGDKTETRRSQPVPAQPVSSQR